LVGSAESTALFVWCRGRPASRAGEPLVIGQGARGRRGTPYEDDVALGPRHLRVRVLVARGLCERRFGGFRVGGAGRNPGRGVPPCCARGRPPCGPSGPSHRDSGRDDLLRFVARLVGLRGSRLALLPRAVGRGVLIVGRHSGYRGVATARLIPDSCLPIVAVLRTLQETLLPRITLPRTSLNKGMKKGRSYYAPALH
jgi:hypothetical protein